MSIKVKVVNAVLTHDTQFFSNMDPYCVLTLGKHQKKTKVKNQAGKRPVWNETFTFQGSDNILKVKVMDQDTVTDDTVGEGSVDLARFRNNPSEQQQFVQLYYKGKTAGRVQLLISGGGQGGNQGYQGNNNNNIMGNIYQGMQGMQGMGGGNMQGGYNQGGNMGGFNQGGMQGGYNQGGMQGGYNQGGNMGGYNQGGNMGGYNQGGMQGGYNQGMQGGYNQGGNMGMQGQPNRGGMGALMNTPPQAPTNNNGQWGDMNQNNGWGNFNPGGFTQGGNQGGNPYPSLDNPQNGGPNPLAMLGKAIGAPGQGQGGNMGGNNLSNPNEQYNLVNGMAMLGGANNQNNQMGGGSNPYQ